MDPVGDIRKENVNTVKAKKPDTEQSRDKCGSPVCKKSKVNSNDLGLYVSNASSLSDQEKYSLIKNVWKPSRDFVFPDSIESQGRKKQFQRSYLTQYYWNVYSKYFDGCFGLPCVLFGNPSYRCASRLTRLFIEHLVHWTSTSARC